MEWFACIRLYHLRKAGMGIRLGKKEKNAKAGLNKISINFVRSGI
jgi:hypothetical protein